MLFLFLGDNVDCWMEIQAGKGPWAPPVSGIVPLGSTLTLVVAINDYRGKDFPSFLLKKHNCRTLATKKVAQLNKKMKKKISRESVYQSYGEI